jgi:hypothetical protein
MKPVQPIFELIHLAETIEAIQEGVEAVAQGRTMSIEQFDEEMRAKYCIPKAK